jgi:hypothetical protein
LRSALNAAQRSHTPQSVQSAKTPPDEPAGRRRSGNERFCFSDGAARILKPSHFIVGKTGFSRFRTVALNEVFENVQKIGHGVPKASVRFRVALPFDVGGVSCRHGVFSLMVGCISAADARASRRRIRKAGKPFTASWGGHNRKIVAAPSRETISVDFGGLSGFRDGARSRIVKAVLMQRHGKNAAHSRGQHRRTVKISGARGLARRAARLKKRLRRA